MAERASDSDAARERELDDVREQYHRELMRKSLRIAELELELAELRESFERSLSWRVTKPLRVRSFIRAQRGASTPG